MNEEVEGLVSEACSRLIKEALESLGISLEAGTRSEAMEFMSRVIRLNSDDLCGAIARVTQRHLAVFSTIVPCVTTDEDEIEASVILWSRLHAALVQFRCLCQLKGGLKPELGQRDSPFFPFPVDAEGEIVLREWLHSSDFTPQGPVDLIEYASAIAPIEA